MLVVLEIVIRARRASDAAFIEALAGEAFGEYNPRSASHAAAMSRERGAHTFVAVQGDAPVGFAVVGAGRDGAAHLDAIAVDAPWRGRGIGRKLLQHAEADARARGAARLALVTAEANVAALDLFIKHGYRVVRTMRRYYPRGQDAHVLEKHLTR